MVVIASIILSVNVEVEAVIKKPMPTYTPLFSPG
jgi:hypothetical protein